VTVTPQEVIDFWSITVGEQCWYVVKPALDDMIRVRYENLWREAQGGKLKDWEKTPDGALALLIVLDQFPRNMFRGKADAFASDEQARAAAKRAVDHGFDMQIEMPIRQFFYTPFEHSENLDDQDRSVALFAKGMGVDHYTHPYILEHRAEIERFGRFPSRNGPLGRISTPEEAEFLRRKP
jgi:uncharacterized protein (DUF924 family)